MKSLLQKKIHIPLSVAAICQFFLLMACNAFTAKAQTWDSVGNTNFTGIEASFSDIAISDLGTPYVVYEDHDNGNKATVRKYNNGSWSVVGTPGFSTDVTFSVAIAIYGDSTLYVAYADGTGSDVGLSGIAKYSNGAWVSLGSVGAIAGGTDISTSLALDNSGTPYVAYMDDFNNYKATVMKYNGSTWDVVGNVGFSAGAASPVIAIAPNGTPYVVYEDNANSSKATVMAFNGSGWAAVGSVGFSAGEAYRPSIAIAPDGTPYVTYQDDANGDGATVMKYSGGNWVTVGNAGFSAGAATPKITIDAAGTPYVVYSDAGAGLKATVMKYNGSSWVLAGNEGFSAGVAVNTSIAISSNGTPYVSYEDTGAQRLTVMDLTSSSSVGAVSIGSETVNVYPNPNVGVFAVKADFPALKDNSSLSLKIINVLGQVVYTGDAMVQNGSINKNITLQHELPNGIYTLQANTGAQNVTSLFVIDK